MGRLRLHVNLQVTRLEREIHNIIVIVISTWLNELAVCNSDKSLKSC